MPRSEIGRSSRVFKSSSGRRQARGAVGAAACETLESRRLLSTISWTNRNTFSGAGDNRFDDVFGSLANQAIAVVDAAIAVWQRTIAGFNYGTGTDTYSLTVAMNPANPPLGTSNTAGSANGGFSTSVNGKPKTGSMGLGWNSGSPPSGNTAGGWYLDPTPNESSEFQGTHWNAFVREPTSNLGGPDLFSVVMHELGHCMGLGSTNATRAVSVDTNDPDTVSPAPTPPTPPITLWAFNGNESLWTEFDSGGAVGGPGNFGGPQHFAPRFAIANGGTRVGAVAMMNSAAPTRATLSDLEADCLRLAYGYSIQRPSRFGTTYAQLDANGTLRINTSSLNNSNDVIVIDESFGAITVSLTLGNRVQGIDPIGTFTSEFPGSSVQRIDIDTGAGNDTIRIESKSGQTGTVNAGEGNDIIEFGFTDRNLSNIAGTTHLVGGGGSDQVYVWDTIQAVGHTHTVTSGRFDRPGWGGFSYAGDIEFLNLTTGTAADTVNVLSTFSNQPVFLFSAGGADTVNIGSTTSGIRSINANVTVENNPSFTTLNINNGPDAGARTWNVDAAGNFGYLIGMAPANIYWDNADIGSINLNCGSGVDTGQFVVSSETFNVNNAGSDDSIRIGVPAAQGLQLISGQITIDNAPATTTLSIDDTGSAIARTITIDEAGGYNTVAGLTSALIRFDNADTNTTIITGSASDTVNVLRNDDTLVINSSGGSDVVNIGNTTNGVQSITGSLTVRNAPSTSTVNINNGPDTVARTAAIQNVAFGADILGQWTGLAPATISYRYLDVSAVNVIFGSAADSILIRNTQKDLNLTTTGGADAYRIGGASDGAQSVLGNITLQNPPSHNAIAVDDVGNPSGRTATLDDTLIAGLPYGWLSGLAPANIYWKYNDTSAVNITHGAGSDSLTVRRHQDALTIQGTAGTDTVTLGGVAGIGMNGITAPATVQNASGATMLVLNDSTDSAVNVLSHFMQDASTGRVTGMSPAAIDYRVNQVNRVRLRTGTQADALQIQETHAGSRVYFDPASSTTGVFVNGDGVGSAALYTDRSVATALLQIGNGGALYQTPGNFAVRTNSLSVEASGKLDISNGGLIVDYTGTSPLPAVRADVTQGYNGGNWQGNGITSSVAAATPGTAVGYAEASTLFSSFPATFAGQSVDSSTVLARYAFAGDADLNNSVSFDDLLVLAANYNQTGRSFTQGNFNGDAGGNVNFDDLLLLAARYNTSWVPATPLPLDAPPLPALGGSDGDDDSDGAAPPNASVLV